MKVRISILVIAICLLWSSLPANHHHHFRGKNKSEVVSICVQEFAAYDKEVVPKKLSPLAVPTNVVVVDRQSGLWITTLEPDASAEARSMRYYLFFRVLRQ